MSSNVKKCGLRLVGLINISTEVCLWWYNLILGKLKSPPTAICGLLTVSKFDTWTMTFDYNRACSLLLPELWHLTTSNFVTLSIYLKFEMKVDF